MRDETGTQMLLERMSFIHNQYCIRVQAKVRVTYTRIVIPVGSQCFVFMLLLSLTMNSVFINIILYET